MAPTSAAPSACWTTSLRDGMRMRLLGEATLTTYGECTTTVTSESRSCAACGCTAGFFQPCGSARKNWTTSAPRSAAAPTGSSSLTWAPISMGDSLDAGPDTDPAATVPGGSGAGAGGRICPGSLVGSPRPGVHLDVACAD